MARYNEVINKVVMEFLNIFEYLEYYAVKNY